MFVLLEKLCTYRKHFEDLQSVGSPAFLGSVDWQREVNVSGILREEQHQEDSPTDRNSLPQFDGPQCVFIFSYTVYSPESTNPACTCSTSFCLRPTQTPEALKPINYPNCLRKKANQWQLQARILHPCGVRGGGL